VAAQPEDHASTFGQRQALARDRRAQEMTRQAPTPPGGITEAETLTSYSPRIMSGSRRSVGQESGTRSEA
jgi:hypothetical protein